MEGEAQAGDAGEAEAKARLSPTSSLSVDATWESLDVESLNEAQLDAVVEATNANLHNFCVSSLLHSKHHRRALQLAHTEIEKLKAKLADAHSAYEESNAKTQESLQELAADLAGQISQVRASLDENVARLDEAQTTEETARGNADEALGNAGEALGRRVDAVDAAVASERARIDDIDARLKDAAGKHEELAEELAARTSEFDAKLESAVQDAEVRLMKVLAENANSHAARALAAEKRVDTLEQQMEKVLGRCADQAKELEELRRHVTTETSGICAKVESIEKRRIPELELAIAALQRDANSIDERLIEITRVARTKADAVDVSKVQEDISRLITTVEHTEDHVRTLDVHAKATDGKLEELSEQLTSFQHRCSIELDKMKRLLEEGLPADVRANLDKMQQDLQNRMAEVEERINKVRALMRNELDKVHAGRKGELDRLLATMDQQLCKYTLLDEFLALKGRVASIPVAPTGGNVDQAQLAGLQRALEESSMNQAAMLKRVHERLQAMDGEISARATTEDVEVTSAELRDQIAEALERAELGKSRSDAAISRADQALRNTGTMKMEVERASFDAEQALEAVRNLRIPDFDPAKYYTKAETTQLVDSVSEHVAMLDYRVAPLEIVQGHLDYTIVGRVPESGRPDMTQVHLKRVDKLEALVSDVALGAASADALRALQREVAKLFGLLKGGYNDGAALAAAPVHAHGPRNEEHWSCLSCEKGPIKMVHKKPDDALPELPHWLENDARGPAVSASSAHHQIALYAQRSQAESRQELLAYRARSASPGNPWHDKAARVPPNFHHAGRAMLGREMLAGTSRPKSVSGHRSYQSVMATPSRSPSPGVRATASARGSRSAGAPPRSPPAAELSV